MECIIVSVTVMTDVGILTGFFPFFFFLPDSPTFSKPRLPGFLNYIHSAVKNMAAGARQLFSSAFLLLLNQQKEIKSADQPHVSPANCEIFQR